MYIIGDFKKREQKASKKKRPEEGKKTPKMSEKEPEGRMKTKNQKEG
ncbi:hypothetical protein ACSAZK_13430 [Methanosarcina sp. Mfa9]